jgi:hypothetical protein
VYLIAIDALVENLQSNLRITLQSDNNHILEYFIDSLGYMKIDRFNGRWSSKNVSIFGQKDTKLFEQLKNLYVDKEQKLKWTDS